MRRKNSPREHEREGILGKLEDHGEIIKRPEKILKKQGKALESHKRHLKLMNSRVETLRQLSEGYLGIRRYIYVHRGDIKHLIEKTSTKAIREGNAAYDGDAVADAFLFECDKRTDRTLFRELHIWPRRRSDPTLSYAFDSPHFVPVKF